MQYLGQIQIYLPYIWFLLLWFRLKAELNVSRLGQYTIKTLHFTSHTIIIRNLGQNIQSHLDKIWKMEKRTLRNIRTQGTAGSELPEALWSCVCFSFVLFVCCHTYVLAWVLQQSTTQICHQIKNKKAKEKPILVRVSGRGWPAGRKHLEDT